MALKPLARIEKRIVLIIGVTLGAAELVLGLAMENPSFVWIAIVGGIVLPIFILVVFLLTQ